MRRTRCTGEAVPLCWRSYPLAQEAPFKSALLMAMMGGVSLGAGLSFAHWFYGALSLGVLILSLSRYFFPTLYALDQGGVHSRHLGWSRHYSWKQFRRAEVRADGVFLSPFVRPSRLDSFRGLFLRFHRNGHQVVYFVRLHVAPE
jgi:hypothetical protein